MRTPLHVAAGQAGEFLAQCRDLPGDTDLTEVLLRAGEGTLTLDTVRALHELAADFQAIFDEYTPEEVARALAR